jgi:hypothetical protein
MLLALGVTACTTSPVSPAGAVTVTLAAPVSPANGAQIPNLAQPVTLTVANATVTDSTAGVTYTFEVANDAGFNSKVATKDVPQTSGQTSLTLGMLPPGQDYYWHVRTTGGDTVGGFTNALKFTIGQPIVVGTPSPVSPSNGSVLNSWPTLTVNNAPHSGPVSVLVYKFDLATSPSFTTIVASGAVSEGNGQTSFQVPAGTALPQQATQYYWRVTPTDQSSGISGGTAPAQNFTVSVPNTIQAKLAAQLGFQSLWPGAQPPGTNGHAVLGDNWQVQTLIAHSGVPFTSPMLEWLQLFDLMDRGFDPQGAIDWMHGNGYPTAAAWFPGPAVIGVQYVYLALINGRWDLVLRNE